MHCFSLPSRYYLRAVNFSSFLFHLKKVIEEMGIYVHVDVWNNVVLQLVSGHECLCLWSTPFTCSNYPKKCSLLAFLKFNPLFWCSICRVLLLVLFAFLYFISFSRIVSHLCVWSSFPPRRFIFHKLLLHWRLRFLCISLEKQLKSEMHRDNNIYAPYIVVFSHVFFVFG